jgi:hypothetical protein
MKMQRFHPAAPITALYLVGALAVNYFSLEHESRHATYLVAALLLASPFAVLLLAHLTLARTWKRNTFLAAGSVLFIVDWGIASFAMRWFQPGWAGAVFFGVGLTLLAGLYALLAFVIPERPDVQQAA